MNERTTKGVIIGAFSLTFIVGVVILLSVFGPRIGYYGLANGGVFRTAGYDMAYDMPMEESMEEPGYFEPALAGSAAPMAPDMAFDRADEAVMVESMEAEIAKQDIASTDVQLDRLIIRNGNISVAVENTFNAKQSIEQLVAQYSGEGAFILSADQYGGSDDSPYISMQIRVPATQFDEMMDAIEGLAAEGTVATRNESAQDVTEEYVDISSRVQSLEAARDRLLQLMEQAETTEDLLAAEQQLTYREAEIESLKGRMNYLAEAARLSLISISLEPYILYQPVDTRWRPLETVRYAFEDLLYGGQDFIEGIIYFIIAVLPWLVVWGLILYGIIRLIMWRVRVGRRKRAEREAQQAGES